MTDPLLLLTDGDGEVVAGGAVDELGGVVAAAGVDGVALLSPPQPAIAEIKTNATHVWRIVRAVIVIFIIIVL